jgi:hypothetical protein
MVVGRRDASGADNLTEMYSVLVTHSTNNGLDFRCKGSSTVTVR